MATKIAQTVQTKATTTIPAKLPTSSAPAIALITPSTTQIPVHAETVQTLTEGEQPLVYCHMKDGTWAYIPQNLLTQTGVLITF